MPFIYANEFIEVLKKKHASGTYNEMVNSIFLFQKSAKSICCCSNSSLCRFYTLKHVKVGVSLKV